MRVAFLYNQSSEDPAQAAEDELPSRSPIVAALEHLGHDVHPVACSLDLATVRRQLEDLGPDLAFNRVESLGGSDSMMAAIPLLLDAMGLPYTGCSAAALASTANKVLVKQRLVRAGLPTPAWFTADGPPMHSTVCDSGGHRSKWIVKAIFEHASFEIDDHSVIHTSQPGELFDAIRSCQAATGRPYFAEEFIDGREFNLSVIGSGPEVLPPAEIDFSAFPADRERIVGHAAKWNADSFEYNHTPRRFDFPAADDPLLQRLNSLAAECWRLFDACGYARVDFRVDANGRPWILEVNTNPCISPDAGFAAAWEQAGLGYAAGIQRILSEAMKRFRIPALASASMQWQPI